MDISFAKPLETAAGVGNEGVEKFNFIILASPHP